MFEKSKYYVYVFFFNKKHISKDIFVKKIIHDLANMASDCVNNVQNERYWLTSYPDWDFASKYLGKKKKNLAQKQVFELELIPMPLVLIELKY